MISLTNLPLYARALLLTGASIPLWSPGLSVAEIVGKRHQDHLWGRSLENSAKAIQGLAATALVAAVAGPVSIGFLGLVVASEGSRHLRKKRGWFEEAVPMMAKWIHVPAAIVVILNINLPVRCPEELRVALAGASGMLMGGLSVWAYNEGRGLEKVTPPSTQT